MKMQTQEEANEYRKRLRNHRRQPLEQPAPGSLGPLEELWGWWLLLSPARVYV